MPGSLKANYIFNLLNTVLGLLFPLITFPYAARVVMADGIGQVNFFSSIISYISLFTCLGIPMYAMREIARVRDDKKKLSTITTEILLLQTGLTILGYFAVVVLCMTITKVKADIPLFLLLSTNIFFVAIGCEWFYQGVEDFKYITIRGLIVKVVSVILLFVLVRTKDDLMYYAAYSVIGVVGGNVFNFIRLRKYIRIRLLQFSELRPLRHLKPALHIFVLNLIISIYVNLDTVMLGFMKDPTNVGYYVGATKLTKMLLGLTLALGTVMLPRLSNLITTGQKAEFDRLSQRAMDFVVAFSLPLFVGLFVLAPSLIRVLCGDSYEPAIITLQVISPIVLIIALSNVVGIQVLYPQGKENIVIMSTLVGAIVNFTLNLVLIPQYAQNGAAIATVIAESCVTITMIILGVKYLPFKLLNRKYIFYLLAAMLMFAVCWGIRMSDLTDFATIIISSIVGVVVYAGMLYLGKDPFAMEFAAVIRAKLSK